MPLPYYEHSRKKSFSIPLANGIGRSPIGAGRPANRATTNNSYLGLLDEINLLNSELGGRAEILEHEVQHSDRNELLSAASDFNERLSLISSGHVYYIQGNGAR
jgi:hypothetical protein